MSIADKLALLISTKQDIKSAISEKGVEVDGGMVTYADAIRRIESGGEGSPFYVPAGLKFAYMVPSYSTPLPPIFTLPKLILADGYEDGTYMFWGNRSLKSIDGIYSPNPALTDCRSMFFNCTSLESISHLDTPNVTDMSNMFENCWALKSVPQMDTSNVTDMHYMFYDCGSLTTIPQMDTSKVTDMRQMFDKCNSLTSIPQLNTSNVTDMSYMFYSCGELNTIPQLNTSNVTDMKWMFANCYSLQTIPQLNTSNVTDMSGMFANCYSLQTIPLLNTSKVTNIGAMFHNSDSSIIYPFPELTDLGGFRYLKVSLSGLEDMPNLTTQSLMNVINNLYNFTGTSTTRTLTIGSINLNKLTDEQKAVAVNKGWVLE